MKINLVLLVRWQNGHCSVPPMDVEVDVSVNAIPLLRDIDSHIHGLASRNEQRGSTGTPGSGSSFSYGYKANVFGHYSNQFYYHTLYAACSLLQLGDTTMSFPLNVWDDANIEELIADISSAINAAASDMGPYNDRPAQVDLYLDISEKYRNISLIEALQKHYGEALRVVRHQPANA